MLHVQRLFLFTLFFFFSISISFSQTYENCEPAPGEGPYVDGDANGTDWCTEVKLTSYTNCMCRNQKKKKEAKDYYAHFKERQKLFNELLNNAVEKASFQRPEGNLAYYTMMKDRNIEAESALNNSALQTMCVEIKTIKRRLETEYGYTNMGLEYECGQYERALENVRGKKELAINELERLNEKKAVATISSGHTDSTNNSSSGDRVNDEKPADSQSKTIRGNSSDGSVASLEKSVEELEASLRSYEDAGRTGTQAYKDTKEAIRKSRNLINAQRNPVQEQSRNADAKAALAAKSATSTYNYIRGGADSGIFTALRLSVSSRSIEEKEEDVIFSQALSTTTYEVGIGVGKGGFSVGAGLGESGYSGFALTAGIFYDIIDVKLERKSFFNLGLSTEYGTSAVEKGSLGQGDYIEDSVDYYGGALTVRFFGFLYFSAGYGFVNGTEIRADFPNEDFSANYVKIAGGLHFKF